MPQALWNSRAASLLFALLLSLLIGKAVRAAQPDSRLLQFVGSEAGLVIEVSDLRRNLPKLKNSEIFRRLRNTNVYRQWKSSADYRGLVAAQTAIEKLVKKPLGEFLADLFGQSVALAVYPTAKDEPETVLITRASSQETLSAALAAWNRAERSVSETIQFSGHSYVRRKKLDSNENKEKKKRSQTQFYVLFDDVLALSDSESVIRRVIELNSANQTEDGVALDSNAPAAGVQQNFLSTAAFRQAEKSLSPKRFVSVYLNPREWDHAVRFDAEKPGVDRLLADFWRRCDSIGFGMRTDGGVIWEMSAHYDRSGLPQQLASKAVTGPPRFLNRVPRNAAVVVAGRNDLSKAAKFLIEQIPQQQQSDWYRLRHIARGLLVGFDLLDDVLPAVGSNWGLYVIADEGESSHRSPFEGLLAIQLPLPGEITLRKVTLRDGLGNALETALHFLGNSDGKKPGKQESIVRTEIKNGTHFGWLETDRPFQPAYALADGYLVGGSSRGVIKKFLAVKESASLGLQLEFRGRARTYFPDANQLLFVNVAELRKFATRNPERFTERLADSKSVDPKEARRRFEQIVDLLEVIDVAFIAGHIAGERVHVVSGVTAGQRANAARP